MVRLFILSISFFLTTCDSQVENTSLFSDAISMEIVYFEKYNDLLRSFPYGKESQQFKHTIQWLERNNTEWNETDEKIGNDYDVSISFYNINKVEIFILWVGLEKATLIDVTKSGLKRSKLINKNEFNFIYPSSSESGT